MKLNKKQLVNNELFHWIHADKCLWLYRYVNSLQQSPGNRKKHCCNEDYLKTRVDFHQILFRAQDQKTFCYIENFVIMKFSAPGRCMSVYDAPKHFQLLGGIIHTHTTLPSARISKWMVRKCTSCCCNAAHWSCNPSHLDGTKGVSKNLQGEFLLKDMKIISLVSLFIVASER